MFIEPNIRQGPGGWIEVICGSMFSGKTEELIRRMKRVRIANLSGKVFKPAMDNRYHSERIVSHDEQWFESVAVPHSEHVLKHVQDVDVVGIDEAQFFDPSVVEVCETLANRGIRVIVAGLDMDYLGKPFGPMPQLLSLADYVTKLHAICQRCGTIAHYSYRITGGDQQVLIGEKNLYEPRCRNCFRNDPLPGQTR